MSSSSVKWKPKEIVNLKIKSISLLYRKLGYRAKLTHKNIIKYVLIISVSEKKIPKSQVKNKISNGVITEQFYIS